MSRYNELRAALKAEVDEAGSITKSEIRALLARFPAEVEPPPVKPPPAVVTPPPVTANSSGLPWKSGGAGGAAVANGTFAGWRGRAVDIVGTWADNPIAQVELWQLQPGFEYAHGKWDGDLDIAVGAIGAGETWAQAATGAYDARWRQSLTNLKRLWGTRPGLLYIRFAHEMNGGWYAWKVNKVDAPHFKAAWIRYRALQKEILPAAKLVFSVNRETSGTDVSWTSYFPGAAHVDVQAVDYYNHWPHVTTQAQWDAALLDYDAVGAPKGLQRHLEFARSVGLPLALSEWASNADQGDSALFMRNLFAYLHEHGGAGPGQVLYEVLFNVDVEERRWALHPATRQPLAAAAYQATWAAPVPA